MSNIKTVLKKLWEHPWMVVATNLLLLMVLYTISRLFFYWVNIDLFPMVSTKHLLEMLAGGVRFDLTAILYLSLGYIAMMILPFPWNWRTNKKYQKVAKWVLWVPNIFGIFCNCVDLVMTRFTDRRLDLSYFSEYQNDSNKLQILLTGAGQYWHIALFMVVLVVVLVYLTRTVKNPEQIIKKPSMYYTCSSLLFAFSTYMIVIGIRGGFGAYTRPITMSNALQYANHPRETLLVLNTPFTVIRSGDSKSYDRVEYYDEATLQTIMTPIHEADSTMIATEKPMNVVVFILESFSKEYIGFYHKDWHEGTYEGYTPFLDSLIAQGVTYTQSYASGRKSIDAMPSVLSSIPMLIEPYVVTPYSTNAISSMAACLKEKGYCTSFFHGAPNGSMGFQAFARNAGFDQYYGEDEYDGEDAYDGTWAIWDEEFLQFMARTLDTQQEPFFSSVFTASSHHPFRVPKRYEGVFPKGQLPIHQCVGYSDHALQQFFQYAKTQPWYDHTLFVITADHTNQMVEEESMTSKGLFEVPILFYYPGITPRVDSTTVVSQTDIMPSVLAALGYDQPYFAFGEDALTKPKEHNYAICYATPEYQLISDSLLINFDGQEVLATYNHVKDPMLTTPVNANTEEMVTYLKAYIQQYVNRMIDNRLVVEKDKQE